MALYERLTSSEYLSYIASLRGGVDATYAADLVDRLGLDPTVKIRSLSHGNKQKVALVQAFMHRPELLVLDEPTQGLDPLVQQEFHRMIGEVRAEGRTVFLSSHVMPEVERLCDRVGIIREGRLIAIDDIEDLKARAVREVEIQFTAPVPPEEFDRLPGVRDVGARGNTIRLTVDGSIDAVVKTAARHEVLDLVSREPSLEEIFLRYYGAEEVDGR
jgi:ABC-2 type transport system ATP-binding protein